MADLLVRGSAVVTMNDDREVVRDGAVVVEDGVIADVGPSDHIDAQYDADRVVGGDDHIVVPGFINAHVHVPDILSRGYRKTRTLYDWLVNVKRPFVAAMSVRDHEIAAAKYCLESIRAGVTTFVENAGGTGTGYGSDVIEAKLDVYDVAGLRNIYAHGFLDRPPSDDFAELFDSLASRHPAIEHPTGPGYQETEAALDEVESLIETYHGTAQGRQSVWPAPFQAGGVTREGLRGAYELAERYDVMTTTHAAESPLQERGPLSTVEYLDSADYLGERTLLGHCVQVDDRDVRLLSDSGTSVSHNVAANLVLGSGVAPVPAMRQAGIPLGLGTDNACLRDAIDVLGDMRTAALTHKGSNRDPNALRAEHVLEMATIGGARAIGRASDLGSIEPGKKADLVTIDADHPHMRPRPNPVEAIVYQTKGHEVDAVVCDGTVIGGSDRAATIERAYPDLESEVRNRSERIRQRAGMDELY